MKEPFQTFLFQRVAPLIMAVLATPGVLAEDWPMLGRDRTRNAVSPEKGAPTDWGVKGAPKRIVGDNVVEVHPFDKNIKWKARLGSSYASPVVAGVGVVPAPGSGGAAAG